MPVLITYLHAISYKAPSQEKFPNSKSAILNKQTQIHIFYTLVTGSLREAPNDNEGIATPAKTIKIAKTSHSCMVSPKRNAAMGNARGPTKQENKAT